MNGRFRAKGCALLSAAAMTVTSVATAAPISPYAFKALDNGWAGTITVSSVPVPKRRPGRARVIGRVEGGVAVPLAPNAFAARAAGPIEELFASHGPADQAAPATAPAISAPAVRAPTVTAAAPATAPAITATTSGDPFKSAGRVRSGLKGALDALRADRYKEAIQRRNGISDPLDRKIVDYYLVRAGGDHLSFAMVADWATRGKDWPSPRLTRVRAEEALSRENPPAARVIQAMGGTAISNAGVRLLARAYLSTGQTDKARTLVKGVWHNKPMGRSLQEAYLKDFRALLSAGDHLIRADLLVYQDKVEEARALSRHLGKDARAYVDARVAVNRGEGDAARKMKRVSSAMKRRAGYRFSEVELKRRAEDFAGAARLIEAAPRSGLVDPDAWWVETRIVARSLAERGKWRRAYKLVTRGYAKGNVERADEAFHAGWFALKGLKDGRTADRHFASLEGIASTPISKARAAYWRGRAAEATRNRDGARRHYRDAARYGFTFYGQLARRELGHSGTGLGRAPQPSASDKSAIARNEVAQAVARLVASGHGHRIWPLLEHLGETLPTAGQVALVMDLARKADKPHLALMTAKEAQRRGVSVGRLAYPTRDIPRTAKVPSSVDRAIVYAIARQESQFNTGAVSPAGARGLMQVMPKTAASLARSLKIRHTQRRLTSDPAYNATLGAHYLAKRLNQYDGSYILTFAAYNAGARRVAEWIERFGDPRSPKVDAIQWVEAIPFPETRNYVQRVMENMQVYREALGTGRLAIEQDLERGRRS